MISKTLMGLAVSSVFVANALTLFPTSSIIKTEEIIADEEEPEACSVFCVGKDASKDGHAIIARTGDTGPRSMNMYTRVFKRNELANKVVKSQTGFEYKMPNYSYRYISTPRCPYMHKGLNWEVSGINEKGVAVTATLSCSTKSEALVGEENFVNTGICEDNITQIVAATASTAREGVQTIADIMETHGSRNANTIVIADQNEIWYMEMYTNHHFAAVKMPDDCICSIGNEFMLEDLAPYGENVKTSKNLLDFATSQGIAHFKKEPKTLENLDLFATFARPLTWVDASGEHNTDNCHMRTWVGYYLFARNNTEYSSWAKKYVSSQKYAPFYKPDELLGVEDVIKYMRDRFGDILTNPDDTDNYEYFKNAYDAGTLRCVGTELAYQIHIIKMHQELPAEIACEEWLCMSNSSYAPFVPLTNGASSLSDYYTFVPTDYGFDDRSAETIFKKLNALADSENKPISIDGIIDPDKEWGTPVQNMWKKYESIWQKQWNQVLESLKDASLSKSKKALESLSKRFQEQAISIAKFTYDDLLLHITNDIKFPDPTRYIEFKPYANIKDFSQMYGWKYSKKDNVVTLVDDKDTIKINVNNGYDPSGNPNGTITINNDEPIKTWTRVKNGVSYLDFDTTINYIQGDKTLVPIDINDLTNNDLAWIIPVCVIVPLLIIAGIVAIVIIRRKSKSSNPATNKK